MQSAVNHDSSSSIALHAVHELPLPSNDIAEKFRTARFRAVDAFDEAFKGQTPSRQLERVKARFLDKTVETAHWAAHQKYEGNILPECHWVEHALNQLLVLNEFEQFKNTKEQSFEQLKQLKLEGIKSLIVENKLNLDIYQPKNNELNGYGKYLLLSDNLGNTPFCFQLFSFGPGQETPVHDHPCECTSTVIRGVILENHFKVKHNKPVVFKSVQREPASQASIDLTSNHPHQIVNMEKQHIKLHFTQKKGGDGGISLSLELVKPSITIHQYVGMNGSNTETRNVTRKRGEGIHQFSYTTAVKTIYPKPGAIS